MRSYREALAALVMSADRLDDVTRARIWAKLVVRLQPIVAPPRRRARAGHALAVAAVAAVAAVVALVVHAPRRSGEVVLVAPAKGLLVAPLGPHAEATLVGPARVVVEGIGEVTTVRLVDGMLVSEFQGGPGRGLRIVAASATIEVVGTLFAVEVHGDVACVSVAHGRVRVTARGQVRHVDGDQRACVRAGALDPLGPIDPTTRAALDRRVAVTPTPTPTPAPTATAPIPPPPPPLPPRPTAIPGRHPRRDAEALYADADAALARGDRDAADRALARLVADAPTSRLVDEALYERARIAYERHTWHAARRWLDELAARPPTSLREPAAFLRCRVAVAAEAPDATACLIGYRATFPASPHDRDVRAMLDALGAQP